MNLFKKTWTRKGKQSQSKKWYISIDKKHVPLSPNKKIAEEMAAQLLDKKAAGTLGVVVMSKDDDRRKSLSALVGEWAEALRVKGTSAEQIELLKARVTRVTAGCSFDRARDLKGEAAYTFIGGLKVREDSEQFASYQTRNFYLSALKQFARFLIRRKILTENPFQDLEPWDVRKDRKHDRRELTAEELQSLIATTEEEGITRSKLSATDRAMLYRVAVFTGLRSAELGSLKPSSFDLAHAEVTVPGEFTKNGDPAVQPLPPVVVPLLVEWLKGKPAGNLCWPGTWAKHKGAGKFLKADLHAAGVPYVKDGLFADFHSLRHSYISRLIRGGTNLKVAQALARHSTITLTADRYGHLAHGEKRAAVAVFDAIGCKQDASSETDDTERLKNKAIAEPACGLENRQHRKVFQGSNPCPSAQRPSNSQQSQ
ncbi:Tyrosine recombinase XerC [Gemmata obscuriglobus]|nr:tyrosine-type recombinase/integrase [Gemmata obscuriglobus]QEG26330.1 Tyrosine recombinase XerC [Gemmata obscuriglobus]VTS01279.1 integrase-recombinase protein : Site-specific recombinase XerD OS=Singulisphaera acidiphila (strain ATCC BAA-1392 / DSM 18658 / VKM B-2454 / MOB10) GN=Sinac_4560 PE=4 SV=1: Phage_integrase [Gemmata obscuriglobus UQM 2246]